MKLVIHYFSEVIRNGGPLGAEMAVAMSILSRKASCAIVSLSLGSLLHYYHPDPAHQRDLQNRQLEDKSLNFARQ